MKSRRFTPSRTSAPAGNSVVSPGRAARSRSVRQKRRDSGTVGGTLAHGEVSTVAWQ